MSAQYTPGPWMAAPTYGKMLNDYSQSWGVASGGGRNLVAGCFSDGEGGDDAAEANARLIAEAPAMVEALREMVAAFDRRWAGESDRKRKAAISPRMEEAIDNMRAILARIDGAAA